MYIKSIKKTYKNYTKIINYKNGFYTNENSNPNKKRKMKKLKPSEKSLIRTKVLITDYVLSNSFTLFCTFTFDPQKVESTEYETVRQKMRFWLNNQRKTTSPDLGYLLVPEQHKSGRYHFHALFQRFEGRLEKTKVKTKGGREIFNIKNWHYGFSTASKIDNDYAVSLYMQKYITKDMVIIAEKNRFTTSHNLTKPLIEHSTTDMEIAEQKVIHKKTGEYYNVYHLMNEV